MARMTPHKVVLHGHELSYVDSGSGPVVLFIHGILGSQRQWAHLVDKMDDDHRVLVPDLFGHGESAKPMGDYSLGAFASGVRDLMVALGMERATVVGHSLGGGVALQLAYQFPERCERLVLVNSGGLGKEVHAILRAVCLPGSELVMPFVLAPQVQRVLATVGGLASRVGFRPSVRGAEVWRSYTGLTEIRGRTAFVHTVRSVIDVTGQRVSARDRLYLAQEVPTLIVWGDRDRIIPVAHAHATHELIPGSTLEIVAGAGHFLPFEAPAAFLRALLGFIDATEPAAPDEERFRSLMLAHSDPGDGPDLPVE